MPGSTKGTGFCNIRLFTRERFGEAGWQRVLAGLTPEDQQQLSAVIPVGWYDLDLYTRLLTRFVEVHGHGDLTALEDVGRFSAEQDLSTIHKFVMKLADPGTILDQSMRLWRRFQDTGTWRIERERNRAVGKLSDWGSLYEGSCRELVGYIEVLIGQGRGKHVRVQHSECRAHGASACTFAATWR